MADFAYSDYYLEALGDRQPLPVHQRFLDMLGYLKKVAPAGMLPGRQHLDPCDFPGLLKLINLVDVERGQDGTRFRFRLVGEEQNRAAGRQITGLMVEDAVVPELVPRIYSNMKKVVECRIPVYDRFPMPHPNRQFIDSQRMYYPLATDGKTVDVIFILNGYDSLPLEAVC